MIRRDAKLPSGAAAWALISQIEHARISAQLAAHCTGRFGAGSVAADVRREVLAAIEHHDDGWAEWERAPRLHADSGKPVSFMELEPEEATAIWTRSIAAAEEHGPLAAWMVAGHFARLLENSEHAHADRHAKAWHDGVKILRGEALSLWQAADPALHTEELAAEALQWLWTFDEMSLWFCCTCPTVDELAHVPAQPSSRTAGQGTPLEMRLEAVGHGLAGAAPWRFDAAFLDVEARGRILPCRIYDSGRALLAAAEEQLFRWRITGTSVPRQPHLRSQD